VTAGSLFVALPGERSDGHDYIDSAHKGGATSFVVTRDSSYRQLADSNCAVALVEDSTDACWRICKAFFGDPSSKLKLVGVTGTNGKTTVAWLLRQMFDELGVRAAYLGTLGAKWRGTEIQTLLTTPTSPELFGLLDAAARGGVEVVAMEASSHALAQRRLEGIEFDAAVFTNLSQDHLDYHHDMEDYFAAKLRLFEPAGSRKRLAMAVNGDDAFGRRIKESHPSAITFGEGADADVMAESVRATIGDLIFTIVYRGQRFTVTVSIGGRFNVSNCLAAFAACIALGQEPMACASALATVSSAPGRFESVETHEDFGVIVDYAHTPDALDKLLRAVREVSKGRVIVVFGCGGDRDKTKRPLMGAAASSLADVVLVTSDNPRTEDPESIIRDIAKGAAQGKEIRYDVDRRKSIKDAVRLARPNDVVVIAGKGHEDYQVIGTTKHPFDDRIVASEGIQERAACA
jgi:UDP-N-acetylmuramoyl-L-alanyl-D-glutamate--2,6-diaminopimelate ligase